MRTPLLLYALALVFRAVLIALFPDPAYPDSSYYVDVARAIAAGNGLNVDFVWIFAEVGNRIPDPAVLPIHSNAHWLPLASFIQAPFVSVLGPTAFANALPGILIGSLAAPLTWLIARDAGARPIVGAAAGVISAIPGAVSVFLAQPENFAILHPLVAACLWLTARGLKGDGRSFAIAGLLAGLATLARNDGILLAGAIALVWLADRLRYLRNRRGRRSWSRVDDRAPISLFAAVAAFALFMLVMGPWWFRQVAVFGSISPTSSSGAALWIRQISEWNSITVDPTPAYFFSQGWGPIIASRLQGLLDATGNFVVMITSVVLLPFLLLGIAGRRGSKDFQPWFVYTLVAFAGATFLYPLHVPGGAFIHTAIGLAPHAAILSIEGVLVLAGVVGGRRAEASSASSGSGGSRRSMTAGGSILVWGVVALVIGAAAIFTPAVIRNWQATRDLRLSVAPTLAAKAAPGDRLMSIDAGGWKYLTGMPGVVSPDDPIETIEAVARAYDIKWLVVERADAARALGPILDGTQQVPWIGRAEVAIRPEGAAGPSIALFAVCTRPDDHRCENKPPLGVSSTP